MTMLEKIARAVYPVMISGGDCDGVPVEGAFSRARHIHLRQRAIALARAAVEAMIEPSEAMNNAAFETSEGSGKVRAYQNMLRAILTETQDTETTPAAD